MSENIKKIINPYKTIQIDYISSKLNLSSHEITRKIQLMILDGDIKGSIDQET